MNRPSPCPQCRSDRIWARAALGAYGISHVAFCPGCARAATLCGRCGGELVLIRQSSWSAPGRAHVETLLQCPTCRQTLGSLSGDGPAQGAGTGTAARPVTAAPARSHARTSPSRPFAGASSAPAVLQRSADAAEADAAKRYTRQRQLVDLIAHAARRADAMARLEIELSRLQAPRPSTS